MKAQFTEQLGQLEKLVIEMGSVVESQVNNVVAALLAHNSELAQTVIKQDETVDALEMQIDEAVLNLLALHQPVAMDLRDIIGISKINGDLERIGDHALNIAQSVLVINERNYRGIHTQISKMADITKEMLKDAIDSFIHKDADQAIAVCRRDDTIDDINKFMFADVLAGMIKDPQSIPISMEIIRISKNFERMADLCTNIAEDVVFIRNAKSIKHQKELLQPK